MNYKMNKSYYSGIGIIGLFMLIAFLAGTHTAIGVASCDYCTVKTIAEVQSDALDVVNANEIAKSEMIVADNKIHIGKVKADSAIVASFKKSHDEINAYAENEKITDNVDADADAKFVASVFRRFDQTAEYYRLAANTLISADSAGMGSGQASRYQQASTGETGNAASGAVAKDHEQLYCAGSIGARSPTVT